MDEFTSGVENQVQENVQDAAVESLVEVTQEPAAVEELLVSDAQQTQQQTEKEPQSEPGWIRRRVDAGIQKGLAAMRSELESQLRSEYEAIIAPMRDRMLEQEASQLVADGEFKSKERALEYLKLKNGSPVQTAQQTAQQSVQRETPRDDNGRFVKRDVQSDAATRAAELKSQADALMQEHGFDAMELFRNNETIKQKVVTGKLDFNDIYDLYGQSAPRKTSVPSPMRSANGAAGGDASVVRAMNDQSFERFDAALGAGRRFKA